MLRTVLVVPSVVAMCFWMVSPAGTEGSQPGSRPLRKVLEAYEQNRAPFIRIVGGRDTTIGKHPWQVGLVAAIDKDNSRAQFCGGSIIGRHWVLTAAHCIDGNTKPEQIAVLVGTNSLLDKQAKRVAVAAGGIKVHENWNRSSFDSDIALVHLAEDVGWTAISPSVEQAEQDGERVNVTGWGAVDVKQDPPRTNILQEVDLNIISRELCNKKASYDKQVTDHMLCIGDYANGQKDSCTGDSGGPATITVSSQPKLVGIVSWSDPNAQCGTPKKPGVYTRVSRFAAWVKTTTSGEVSW